MQTYLIQQLYKNCNVKSGKEHVREISQETTTKLQGAKKGTASRKRRVTGTTLVKSIMGPVYSSQLLACLLGLQGCRGKCNNLK